jgi:la-related protein 1
MTSTASRPLGEPGAGATTFSYAEAAKGRAAPTTVSTAQISQHTSGTNTPSRESNSTINTPSGSVNGATNPDIDRGVNKCGEGAPKATSTSSEVEFKAIVATALGSDPSSPSLATALNSNLPKEEEHLVNANPTSNSLWDKQMQDETPIDKSLEGIERKKAKKAKKDKSPEKEAETEKEELKIEVLVAAPPPAVNFWQQRIEAAKAKSSPQTSENPQLPTGDSNVISAISSTTKPFDPRKKGKVLGAEESDRSTYFNQNGGVKDQQSFTKSQRKASEGNVGSKEEFSGKRSAPRGSRIGEKEEKSTASQLPPPVGDATSWPTPETALEEERRKALERLEKEEKDESVPNKPRPKEKWVPVPYIPTVTFNTPLPSRGGRARGGARGRDNMGRGGHASNSSISGEKTFNSSVVANNPGTETRERGRDTNNSGRATSLPPNASKRPTGETHFSTHDQRKPTTLNLEKPKHEYPGLPNKTESPARDRRSSIATQTELSSSVHQEPQQSGTEFTRSGKSGPQNGTNFEKSIGPDRRIDSTARANDTKEANGHTQTRDRSDGRLERGRGGFRGRGAHGNFANGQQTFTNGHSTQQQNGYSTTRQNAGPYSPPLQQGQYPATYQANPNRGRAGPRSQSIPTSSTIYARYPSVQVTTQQIPPLQTAGPVFEYAGMQTMSAVSYNPYIEQYSVLAMVTMQLEYYFSIDNLCKDVFLRKHMDSQGFVFLAFIAKFRRIQSLTSEFDLLRFACQESEVIDIVTGDDGIDRIRRQDGWEKWVLAMEERDETAKNAGPERYTRLQIQTRHQPLVPRMMAQPHPVMSPTIVAPNSAESSYRAYPALPTSLDGVEHPIAYITESPLSAAVPDFAPSPPTNEMSELEAETTFTDEEVDNLQLVYNRKSQGDTKPKVSGHSPSSRTFSNGSIDGRSIHEELLDLERRQGRTLINGGSPTSDM